MNSRIGMKVTCAIVLSAASLLAGSAHARGTTAADLFAQGNRLYYEEDYDGAIRCYQDVLRQEGAARSLFHNLASAYHANGELGRAILNSERALWMAPRDPDALASAEAIRKDAALFDTPRPGWQKAAFQLSLNEWTWLVALSWGTLGGLCLLFGAGWPKRLPFFTIAGVTAVALIVSSGAVVLRARQIDRAVVLADDAPLLVSPFGAAKRLASVQEGRVVTMSEAHGDFVKVRTESGHSGWIPVADIARIVPAYRADMLEPRSGNSPPQVTGENRSS